MFILKQLMENNGYTYKGTIRPMSNIREVTFRKTRSLREYVTIRVDERDLQGISNRRTIMNHYIDLINKAIEGVK